MVKGVNSLNDARIRIATPEEIVAINKGEEVFKQGVGAALSWIYRQQNWTGTKIAKRIRGLKPDTWRCYGQPAYQNNRSLHIVAAFSWLSQVSMLALLKGSFIQKHWDGMDEHSVSALLHMCLLNRKHFYMLICIMIDALTTLGFDAPNNIFTKLAEVCEYPDNFLAPLVLDLESFKMDYYRSTGLAIAALRENFGFSVEEMAFVLGITVDRYYSYENPDHSTNIPVQTAYRLKLGFHLPDTTSFLVEMKEYPGFFHARRVQQLRDEIVFSLFNQLPDHVKPKFVNLARENMLFSRVQA